MNLDDPQEKDLKNKLARTRPMNPPMSQSGRNVAILILFSALLLISAIEYFSIEAYFKHHDGMIPVLQTGGQIGTQTSIELPPIETTSTPATMTATLPASPPRTIVPTSTVKPPRPSDTPAASPTPSASATGNGTSEATLSPTPTAPGPATPSSTPTQASEPTQTITPTPPSNLTPTKTPAS